MDIAERKTIEESLRKLSMAVEHSPESIVITDVNGTIEYVNPKFTEVTGYTSSEAIGQNPRVLKSGITPKSTYPELWGAILAGREWRGEFLNKKKNGELYWEMASISPVKDDHGQITHFVAVKQDITEQKRTEQKLKLAQFSIDRAADEIFWVTPEGKISYANDAACKELQYTQAQLQAMRVWDFDPLFKRERWAEHWQKIREQGSFTFETVHQAKTGSTFPVEISVNYVRFGDQEFNFAFVKNITARKRAEDQLRTLSAAIEQNPAGVKIVGTDQKILYVNPTFTMMTGYQAEEVIGRVNGGEMPEGVYDPVTIPQMLAAIRAGKDWQGELQYIKKGGERFWTASRISAIRDESGTVKGYVEIAEDITERKQTENLLRMRMRLMEFATAHSLKEILQETLDEIGELTGSQIGFYHFVEPDQQTLSLQTWSTRTLREFCTAEGNGLHYSLDRAGVWVDCVRERRPVIHNHYASLPHKKGIPEGHAAVIRELVVPILRGGLIVAILGVGNKLSDYDDRDVEAVTYLADIAWEIAEHKRAEEALRESEEKFRLTFDQSPIGAVVASLDFRFLKVNSEFCRITGYTEQELLSRSFPEITFRDDVDKNVDMAKKVAAGELSVYEIDKRYIRKDGDHTWVRVTSRIMRDASGSPLYYLAMVVDINERRRAEEAIAVKNRELGLINSITTTLNSSLVFGDKLRKVLHDALELAGADAGAIYLADEDHNGELNLSTAEARTSAGQSIKYLQVLDGGSLAASLPGRYGSEVSRVIFSSDGFVSLVPLAVTGQNLGLIVLYCDREPGCKEVPGELLAIGSQVGIAIENYLLFKKIEDASRYLADIINESPDPILTTDTRGTILSFNKRAATLLKFEPGEVIGNSLSGLLPPGQRIDMSATTSYVRDFVCKDGTSVTLSVSIARIHGDGTRPGHIITLKDLSNITGFKVVPITEKAVETDQLYHFEKGYLYLLDRNEHENFMEIFADQVKHNIQGLCITRHSPKKVREQHGLEKTPIVWLTGNEGVFGEICLKPDNLSGLSATVNKFISEAKDGLIMLDGIEYLMMRNNYESLLKFIHFLNDHIMVSNCRVICCADPGAFDDQQYRLIATETEEYDQKERNL